MTSLHYLLALPWVMPLAWTLVHFLWQGALIGLAAGLLWRAWRDSAPATLYLIGLGALLACVVAPVATFVVLAKPFAPRSAIVLGNAPVIQEAVAAAPAVTEASPSAGSATAGPVSAPKPAGPPRPQAASVRLGPAKAIRLGSLHGLIPWVVPLWLLGVCFLALRLAFSWVKIQRWRWTASPMTADWVEESVAALARLLRMRAPAEVRLSSFVPGPLTFGFFKPVILLPASLLSGLPREQIEAILAHELAHIRRHDYAINLLQSTLEVVLFYHPVVWWLNQEIRRAREECCDELAASACADRKTYVRALTALAELRINLQPAMGAQDGELLSRVLRLLGRRPPEAFLSGKNAAWFLCLLIATLTASGILFSARLIAAEHPSMANTKHAPHGIVLDETGTPVNGAEVLLYHAKNEWGLGNRIVERVRSDVSGRFAFHDRLKFEVPHGTDATDHYALFALVDAKAPAWSVILGGTPDEPEYRLIVTKPVSQSYEAVDREGKPLAGVKVWLRYASSQADKKPFFAQGFIVPEDLGLCSAVTDAQGKVTLANLPNTTYSVAASGEGFENNMSCTTPKGGVPKFTMVPAASLEGRVTDPLGQPVEGATIWLYPKFRWHQYFLARTDSDGRYRVDKIWSNGTTPDWGKYDVGVTHPNFTARSSVVAFTSGEQRRDFNLSVEPGVLLKGVLLDPGTAAPVAGGWLLVDSNSGRRGLKSDNQGQFQCRVIEGEITVIAQNPPGGCYYAEARAADFPDVVRTRTHGTQSEVRLYLGGPLGRLGQLQGVVLSADGTPAALCAVKPVSVAKILRPNPFEGGVWRGVYTNVEGQFSSDNVPVGLPFVVLANTSDGRAAGLAKGEMTTDIQTLASPVHLAATGKVSLALVDGDGKPLALTEVSVTPVLDGQEVYSKEVKLKSGKTGSLTIANVIPGLPYRIQLPNSRTSDTTVELLARDGTPALTQVALSDKYVIQVEDPNGQPISVAKFREYWVWILDNGKRVQWTNDGRIPILAQHDGEVVVSREPFILGRAGDKVDAVVEAADGSLLRTSGTLPALVSEPLVLRATTAASKPDSSPDATITEIKPDEIAGRVLDPQGRPVEHATISEGTGRSPGAGVPAETDASGVFRFTRPNKYPPVYLTIFKEGYAPIFLTDVALGHAFSVSLQNTTRLKGTIGGERPGKVSILLEKDKPTKRENMSFLVRGVQFRTETRADGSYDFPIEPGTYRFQLRSADGRFLRGEVAIKDGETAAFPGDLQSGDSVVLKLIDWQTGQPVPGIEVSILERLDSYTIGNLQGSEKTSGADGLIRWDNLMPGPTEFSSWRMSGSLGVEKPQFPYVRWWRQDEPVEWRQVNAAKAPPTRGQGVSTLTVEVGPEMKPVLILLEKGVMVSGTVMSPEGKPLADIQVGVVPSEGRRASLMGDSRFTFRTDEGGKFSGYIPAGNGVVYNLCAYTWPEKPGPFSNAVSESFSSKPGDEFHFNLKMSAGAWVDGRVVDPQGSPIAGLEVQATNLDYLDNVYADRLTKTDAEGKFRLGPLRPGASLIQTDTMEGVNIASPPPGFTPPTVKVKDGEEKELGDIVFPRSSTDSP